MLTENDVIKYTVKELDKQGFRNIETVDTYKRDHDIVAEKDGKKIFIEAKGQTSSKYSNRFGMEFTHAQKKTQVSIAIYKCMQILEKEKDCSVAIAIPKDTAHEKIILRIAPSLKKLNIQTFFVSQNGEVNIE